MSHLLYVRNSSNLTAANLLGTAGDWQDRALCQQVDPEIFYPDKGESNLAAKRVCRACDVRQECLNAALDRDEQYGVWGGLSEKERRALKKGPRGGPTQPIQLRQRPGIADHHTTIVEMLDRPKPATWKEIGTAIGWSGEAARKYWERQKQAAEQQELAA